MGIKRVVRIIVLMVACIPIMGALHTEEIIKTALDKDCYDFCVEGTCFWLKCSVLPPSCKTVKSIKVSHRNPEVVISVYGQPNDNPWEEMEELYHDLVEEVQEELMDLDDRFADVDPAGGLQSNGQQDKNTSLQFFEAQAIGHPMALLGTSGITDEFTCPPASTPFLMHFSSEMNVNVWRDSLVEMLQLPEVLPGFREVGEHAPLQTWGGVFPRIGFIYQYDSVKAAAVIAQRVANIITRNNQAYLYSPITNNNFSKTRQPGEVRENNLNNHAFQMIYPKEDKQCYVFGENDSTSLGGWSEGRKDDKNQYAFTLWRPYTCCKKKGKKHLFDIDLPKPICL